MPDDPPSKRPHPRRASEGRLATARAHEIDQLLVAALDLELEQREDYLRSRCGEDQQLRREVEGLLRAVELSSSRLRSGGAVSPGLMEVIEPSLVAGDRLGRYRALEEIGRGGMGVVYLAERADGQFEQKVAIKVLPPGHSGEELARFARERQILAQLEHPNIARLIDGGVTEHGQPFLVMEHVAGQPIDRYCQLNGLSLEARIRLLITVCRAVEAAHRQLVVHRDLKPNNILVSAEGEVKLLDFGIAKVLVPGQDEGTRTRGGVMTPQYASPEQVRGQRITALSDVYQLGLLAYELLSGARPYDLTEIDSVTALKLLLEQAPEPPSAARERLGEASGPPVRASELRGDLDRIVLMALRKEPERRYLSADRLREDFNRHLAGLPVAARSATWSYRLSKFVRRHTVAVTISAVALSFLLALSLGFTWRLARERDQTRLAAERAEQERALAEERREESEEVVSFLVDLFHQTDPFAPQGLDAETTALELLKKGGAQLAEGLEQRPQTQAQLLATVGGILNRRGHYEKARPLLERAIALRREAPDDRRLELAESLRLLGSLFGEQGKPEAVIPLREALALYQEILGPNSEEVARVLLNIANWGFRQGDYAEAEAMALRALDIIRSQSLVEDKYLCRALGAYGSALSEQRQFEPALAAFEEALACERRLHPPDHPLLAIPLLNIATLHSRRGQFEKAVPLHLQAAEIYEKALGPNHTYLAHALENLAVTYFRMKDFARAEAHMRHALAINEEALGAKHPEVSKNLINLGGTLIARERFTEALPLLRRALEIQQETLPPRHPFRGFALATLGTILAGLGDDREAEAPLVEGLEILKAALSPEDPNLADPLRALAGLRQRAGRLESAEDLFRRAFEIRRQATPPDPEALEETVAGYTAVLRARGKKSEARAVEDELAAAR